MRALSYGFLIYAVNKQRAARGFGKGMEIRGSGEVEARCNIKRVSSSRTQSSRDSLDETLTTRQDCPGKSLKQRHSATMAMTMIKGCRHSGTVL